MKNLDLRVTAVSDLGFQFLVEAMTALRKFVCSVATLEEQQQVTVSTLRSSSSLVRIQAPTRVVDCLRKGIRLLESHDSMPDGWNLQTLRAVRAIASLARLEGIETVSVGYRKAVVTVDSKISRRAHQLTPKPQPSLETVTGKLYRYSSRPGFEISIVDEKTHRSVPIEIHKSHREEALKLMDSDVQATGVTWRDPQTKMIRRIELKTLNPAVRVFGHPARQDAWVR